MKNLKLQDLSKTDLIEEIERFSQRELLFEATETLAHVGHYEWDYGQNRLASCSEEYARLFGTSVEEIMAAHTSREGITSYIHADDRAAFTSALDALRLNHDLDLKYRIIRKDGKIRYIHEISVAILADGNQDAPVGCFGILLDITDSTKHERDLEYRDTLTQQAEEIADLGYFIFDLEAGNYDYISPGFGRIHGVSCEAFLDKVNSREDDMADVHVDDYDRLDAVYVDHREKGSSFSVEYRIHRADGAIRWIREDSKMLIWGDSNKRQSLGVLQDITRQRRHQQDLEHREVLAQQAESITDIGHFIYDEQAHNYLYLSPGFARIHGSSVEDYKARVQSLEDDIADIHEDDRGRVAEEYRRYVGTHEDCDLEYRLLHPDGNIRWLRELGTAHQVIDGKITQTLGVVQDITPQKTVEEELREARARLEKTVQERTQELADTVKRLQEEIVEREKISAELKFLANHDALTGLPSLRLCKDRLERSLIESRRSQKMTAVMFIDLDGFKAVNDTYGHEFGDVVLRTTADRIKAVIREIDTVARIGGDEFIIIMSSVPDSEIVQRVANNLIEQVGQVIQVNQIEVAVSASLGIALYPEDGTTSEELIRRADSAMYQVKNAGKNNFGFFQPKRLN
jgi:diguanylate cyclase (GGDEF)-like protein/PAS domain S-box-containing protein